MKELFLQIVNMSITASWLVPVIVLIRLVFKKAPKSMICFLWLFVAIRLIVPFSFESSLSLIPSANVIPEEIIEVQSNTPNINVQTPVENDMQTAIPNQNVNVGVTAPSGEQNVQTETKIQWLDVLPWVWVSGILVMAGYAMYSYRKIYHQVQASINTEDNLWICDDLSSPFILGVLNPRIYVPSALSQSELKYIIAHEKAHLSRHDHWWKPLGYVLLAIHWFNPVMWAAYILLCRDIEMACDEKVIMTLGEENKGEYSRTLLMCSVPRHLITACPLAFGEVSVKQRVKSVLNYKKPAFWVLVCALVVCVAVPVFFLSDPLKTDPVAQAFMSQMMQEETTMTLNARAPYDFWSYNESMKVHYTKMTDFQLDKTKEGDFHFVESIQQLLSDTYKETEESASFYHYSDPVMTIMLEHEDHLDSLMINLDGYMKIVNEAIIRYYKISSLQVDELIDAYAEYLLSLGEPYAQQEYIDRVLLNKGGEECIGWSAGTTSVGGYMQFEIYTSSPKNDLSDMDLVIGCDAGEYRKMYGNAVCTFSNAGYSNDGHVTVEVDYYLESNPEKIYTHRSQMYLKENR